MRYTSYMAASALALQSIAFAAAPAFAADTTVPGGQLAEAQAMCDSLLKPNANSGFVTAPVNGHAVLVNHTQTEELVSGPTPVGDPVYGDISFDGLSVNGHSGNLWATPTAHSRTFADSVSVYHIHVEDTYNYTYDCKVWKTIVNKSGTKEVVPPDQQTFGHATSTWTVTQDYNEERHTGPYTEYGSWAQSDDAVLVCNRPQGIWTQQNGYTGDCSDDSYVGAGGDPADLETGNGGGNSGGGNSGGGNSGGGSGNGGGNSGGGRNG